MQKVQVRGKTDNDVGVSLIVSSIRRALATSLYLVNHRALTASPLSETTKQTQTQSGACAHYFVDPLSWMRPELEQGKLDGRLECPKCHANVGKYAWQGMQCSCGDWVVPGISLVKGKLDEVKHRQAGSAGSAIRMPPALTGRRTGASGHENL